MSLFRRIPPVRVLSAACIVACVSMGAGCAGSQTTDDEPQGAAAASSSGATSDSGDERKAGADDGNSGGSFGPPPGEVRPQHYSFAHRVFRKVFFDRPVQMMMLMKTGRGEEALLEMWDRLGEEVEPDQRIEVDELPVHLSQSELHGATQYLAIIELPPPKGTTEAHMIGLVVQPAGGSLQAREGGPRDGTKYWYYTLERSVKVGADDSDGPRTVLGGWNSDSHLNFGEGPSPEVAKFRQAIEEHLKGRIGGGGRSD